MEKQKLLKRALWLAFQASSPMGLGFLHTASAEQQTEDSLFESYSDRDVIYTDYVHGRMMKTQFTTDGAGQLIVNYGHDPRVDYQSWGAVYPTNQEFVQAVYKSLE